MPISNQKIELKVSPFVPTVTLDKVLFTIPKVCAPPLSIAKNTKLKLLKDNGKAHICCVS